MAMVRTFWAAENDSGGSPALTYLPHAPGVARGLLPFAGPAAATARDTA